MYSLFPILGAFIHLVHTTKRPHFLLWFLIGTTTVFADSSSISYVAETPYSLVEPVSDQSSSEDKLLLGPDEVLNDFRQDYSSDTALEARIEKRIQKIEKNYIFTDKKKFCIRLSKLDKASALSDNFIFFENRSGTAYVNHLEGPCPRLALENRFSYEIIGSTNLCQGMLISVLDPFGRIRASCALGYFQILDRNRPVSPHGS